MGFTTRDLLDHLMDRYGKITATDLKENAKRMNEPINTGLPITKYFERIGDCVQFADVGKTPCKHERILQMVYLAVLKTVLYGDAGKEWRNKSDADCTWTNFKTTFADEYHDLKLQQRLTMGQAGFHEANDARGEEVVEIEEALDQLAIAETVDRDVVASLTASIKQLTDANRMLTYQVKALTDTNQLLTKQIEQQNQPAVTQLPGDGLNTKQRRQKRFERRFNTNGYCWSHGVRVTNNHNSKNCDNRRS
eukprot:CAMPEP_0113569390 /NCGR_PEP_ID=MMETSP0015_2-20120614/24388_1 /TAXON_ID=2838 /ORGANISM="Odontella" /LENGTH=249 /DNA_ID=CAMNT_0000472057 /DNA_START=458 /DNA_END=1203 /DNA_ORIENTATION=+ /assembly_acc=CAM_ASM_000160